MTSSSLGEVKKGIDTTEYEWIRELAIFSKKEGMTDTVASHYLIPQKHSVNNPLANVESKKKGKKKGKKYKNK